jgi:hypothetical protein
MYAGVSRLDQPLGRREEIPHAHTQAHLVQNPVGVLAVDVVLDGVRAPLAKVDGRNRNQIRYGSLALALALFESVYFDLLE